MYTEMVHGLHPWGNLTSFCIVSVKLIGLALATSDTARNIARNQGPCSRLFTLNVSQNFMFLVLSYHFVETFTHLLLSCFRQA